MDILREKGARAFSALRRRQYCLGVSRRVPRYTKNLAEQNPLRAVQNVATLTFQNVVKANILSDILEYLVRTTVILKLPPIFNVILYDGSTCNYNAIHSQQ